MKNLLWTLLLGCLLVHAGCKTPQQHSGPKVYIMDTFDGRGHVVSAAIREDGQFSNSITIDGRTQTISGKVTKTDDAYLVTVDYNSTQADVPGLKQVRSTVSLKQGESKTISGIGNDVVSVGILN